MGKVKMKWWILSLVLLFEVFQVSTIWGAPAYTSGATGHNAEINLWFKPSGWTAQYVIVHYIVSGKGQENVYMKFDSKKKQWEYLVRGLKTGQTITYSFTYNIAGIQYDTPEATYPSSGGSGGNGSNYMYNKLVWSDEFDGTTLNRKNWNYQIGNGYNPGLGYFDGWGNGEWEWYREENVFVANGNLVIKGEYLSKPYVFANRNWYQFSGRITTKGLRSWKYARVEARIKLPAVYGTWPAFWMMGDSCDATVNGAAGGYDKLPTNWASCGEIDIMEQKNTDNQICSNLYWDTRIGVYPWASDTNAGNPTWTSGVDVTQYHVYAVEWNATTMKYYLDGKLIKVQDISAASMEEFHNQKWFIILNLAISGSFTGYAAPNPADFPCYMYVDYVRVYQ